MNSSKPPKNYLRTILLIIYIQYVAFAAVMSTTSATTSTSTTPTTPLSTAKTPLTFTQPTFNFDFSSMRDRSTAQAAMTDARSNWGNFFA